MELGEYDYLWKSGEWGLHQSFNSSARVIIGFPQGKASIRELAAIRGLLPELREQTSLQVKQWVADKPEIDLGDFSGITARDLRDQAQRSGLKARLLDTSFVSYLPIQISNGNLVCIIEDNDLKRAVTDEMLRQGVPIVSVSEHD